MNIRMANPNDAMDILEWRNDSRTRAMSWNVEIIDKATHIKWFNTSVTSRNKLLLIGELGKRKIGMVRFDRLTADMKSWKVSIMVSPDSRSQGVGTNLLTQATSYFHEKFPGALLIAEVKASNTASRYLFERVGFSKIEFNGQKMLYELSF